MARKFHKPQRMCIVCRTRSNQEVLLRLQCHGKSLTHYKNQGRSFYVCRECIERKQCAKALARQCKTGELDLLMKTLKEIAIDVR